MRRTRAALAAWVGLSIGVAQAAEQDLDSRLDAVLKNRALSGAQVGALVVSRDDGRVLYQRAADRALVPASNQKILTSIAMLSALGPTYRFTTEVFADAPIDAEGGVGVLAIRGGGDPALTSEQMWRLAADLRLLGLRRVRQGLLLDASAFDDERWHPSWGAISARAYHAPVAALSANYGAFSVTVEPGVKTGEPARVRLDPPVRYLRLKNQASTGDRRAPVSLAVDRKIVGTAEDVVVSGVIRVSSDRKHYYKSVIDPVRYAGSVLRMQLEANGITVEGENRLGRVGDSMTSLLGFEGKSLADIVKLFLKYSSNPMGEGLVKALDVHNGGVGSWSTGVAALRTELARLGLDVDRLSIVDGSGLSYQNRVTPRALVSALRIGDASFRFGPEFLAALPIAAADGTLEERAVGAAHQVRAKTGLLTRITSLSGYAETADGEQRVFSILVNGFTRTDEEAMDAVDLFAGELVD
jgi:D-alanyl-D-alanine carboxypeptidase/D-alanyl-D-alanine-endopeptidase (penicillin-binding protein 4)